MRGPVRVDWRDASFELEGSSTPPEEYLVETFGWIVAENTRFLTVASERLPDDGIRAVTYIPKVNVERIQDLEEGL
jgi:hypothetical protein